MAAAGRRNGELGQARSRAAGATGQEQQEQQEQPGQEAGQQQRARASSSSRAAAIVAESPGLGQLSLIQWPGAVSQRQPSFDQPSAAGPRHEPAASSQLPAPSSRNSARGGGGLGDEAGLPVPARLAVCLLACWPARPPACGRGSRPSHMRRLAGRCCAAACSTAAPLDAAVPSRHGEPAVRWPATAARAPAKLSTPQPLHAIRPLVRRLPSARSQAPFAAARRPRQPRQPLCLVCPLCPRRRPPDFRSTVAAMHSRWACCA